jgi:hypothetical protein
VMGVILSEFALIPFMETRRPSTLLLVIQNMHFFWVQCESCLTHIGEGLYQIRDVGGLLLTCYDYVIDV